MGLTFNGKTPSAIQIGGKQVDNIVMNGEVVWPEQPTGPDYFYISFGSVSPDSSLTLKKVGSNLSTGSDLSYSRDKQSWTLCTYDANNECIIPYGSLNSRLYFRSSTGFSTNETNYYRFSTATNRFSVGGDIRTLMDYTDVSSVYTVNVPLLFYHNTMLIDAGDLDCSHITYITSATPYSAPDYFSWNQAFDGCTNLSTPPLFKDLARIGLSGANYMFRGCSSLTKPIDLSKVYQVQNFHSGMNYYSGVRSLYEGCTSLNEIIVPNVSKWYDVSLGDDSYTAPNWVTNVAATGTAYCPAGLTISTGDNGIPSGWTRVDY